MTDPQAVKPNYRRTKIPYKGRPGWASQKKLGGLAIFVASGARQKEERPIFLNFPSSRSKVKQRQQQCYNHLTFSKTQWSKAILQSTPQKV